MVYVRTLNSPAGPSTSPNKRAKIFAQIRARPSVPHHPSPTTLPFRYRWSYTIPAPPLPHHSPRRMIFWRRHVSHHPSPTTLPFRYRCSYTSPPPPLPHHRPPTAPTKKKTPPCTGCIARKSTTTNRTQTGTGGPTPGGPSSRTCQTVYITKSVKQDDERMRDRRCVVALYGGGGGRALVLYFGAGAPSPAWGVRPLPSEHV